MTARPDPPPREVRSDVLSVRVYAAARRRVDERAATETGGDRSVWLRRALAYAARHMPTGWTP